jgi:hypothetical protein
MNHSSGPVLYHQRPVTSCPVRRGDRACGRKSVFPSGRCSACEDAHERRDFAVLDSYLPGGSRHDEA